MISQILVPMDESEPSQRALAYALDNFPEAEITVLHVVGVPSMMMGEATALASEQNTEESAAVRAEPVFKRARAIATERDRTINTVVGMGHPVRNILDIAANYETIVLGAHGKDRGRAIRRFLVGNVTETVTKRAPVPVVVVR